MSYFLTSQRLGFRVWQLADLPLAQTLWSNPDVARFLGTPPTPQAAAERLQNEIALNAERGMQYWPIFLLDSGLHVGCAGVRPYRDDTGTFELGYHLLPDFWGQGLAGEAARAVMRYAFTTLGVSELFAGHHPDNPASGRVLTRIGFRYAGMQFYAAWNADEPTYRLTLEEWNSLP